jgi:Protein of unknown function (DUF2752)
MSRHDVILRADGPCQIHPARVPLTMSAGNASSGDVHDSTKTRFVRDRVSPLHRLIAFLTTTCFMVVFGIAVWLSPDGRGFGTHEQLGLPPCQFRVLSGWNCPHCGMTTSFAHFVRGQWISSFQANAAGLLLAMTCVVVGAWCLVIGFSGRWFGPDDPRAWLIRGVMIYLVITLVLWLFQFVPSVTS